MEIKRGGRSYTADTIKQIKSENENAEIFFLCGTDMILTMDCWYKPEYIFANATIVYARRESETEITEKIAEKCELYKQKFGAHIIYTENNAIEASSTEIREAVIKNDNASGLLSKAVYDYIKEKNLYSDILENLENMDSLKSELRQKEIREKLRYINLGLEWFEDEMQ